MQKLSSFGRGKKFRPKKSLTSLLHAALEIYPDFSKIMVTLMNVLENLKQLWKHLPMAHVFFYSFSCSSKLPLRLPYVLIICNFLEAGKAFSFSYLVHV